MRNKCLEIAIFISIAPIFFVSILPNIECPKESVSRDFVASSRLEVGVDEKVALTIVYDNNPYDERLKTAWDSDAMLTWTR